MPPISLHVVTAAGQTRTLHLDAAHAGMPLADLLRRANLPLNTRCGQRSLCDGCMIELVAGALAHRSTGESLVADTAPVLARACDYILAPGAATTIHIPARSALAYEPQVLTDYRIAIPYAHHPIWQQHRFPVAALRDMADPREALAQRIAHLLQTQAPVLVADAAVAGFHALKGSHDFLHATAEYHPAAIPLSAAGAQPAHWLVADIAAVPRVQPLGAAIDIGTTTVAILLVDLTTGKVLARAANFNQQINLGDDVVTRITLCANDKTQVAALQRAVADETIAPLIAEALAAANLKGQPLVAMTLAGNTTMQHLVAGIDPTPMGTSPFPPVFLDHQVLPENRIFSAATPIENRKPIIENPAVHLLPSAAAYIGADLTAGILASGLLYDDGPSLLVDVGTNGEIIFKHGNRLLACATAAGPAFEGAGLSHGIRAGHGAIAHIAMTPPTEGPGGKPFSFTTKTIGQPAKPAAVPAPIGLCGSFYIDFLAEARRLGLLNAMGRYDLDAVPTAAPHLVGVAPERAFKVAEAAGRKPILVTETDISRLLSAKAAIAAGILILLQHAGVAPMDIRRVYLAGGFGTHMNPAHAITCGLLPGFAPGQIVPVGNTALAGAYLALLDSSAADEIARLARRIEIIELNLDPRFEDTYIDQLALP